MYRANFLWPYKPDSIEAAAYEFANGQTDEYQEIWWNILVEKIRLAERQACAADVCPRCAAGDERETNGSGWFHRQPDQYAGHLYSACPAAPIHPPGRAPAEKESDHE